MESTPLDTNQQLLSPLPRTNLERKSECSITGDVDHERLLGCEDAITSVDFLLDLNREQVLVSELIKHPLAKVRVRLRYPSVRVIITLLERRN